MKQLVSVNLTTRTAKDWTPPELTFGESLTLALRFFKNSDGQEIEAPLTITSLKASIGLVDARPTGGKYAIKIGTAPASGSNTTNLLDATVRASDLAAKLNAVDAHSTYGTARVIETAGSWLIFFGDQSQQVPMTVVGNGLWPISYARVHAWQVDGKWVHELRLVQAPVAFTSSHDIVLPPAPEITRIQAGGATETFTWNEIQQLYVPPEFRGAYILKRGYGKTTQLSRDDGTDAILAALQALGANDFKVTLPLSNKPTIEFIGDYAGAEQDLLVVQVMQAPAGDLTFTLALDRAELASMLRRDGTVTLPLEIRIVGTDDGGFSGELVALVLPVTIKSPVIFPELEETPTIDLLRPYSATTYVPYGANNELVGGRYYRAIIGDGEMSEFVIATGLNSEDVFVVGRENHSGGRQLAQGVDFSVTIDGDNQVTVTSLVGPPAANGWIFFTIGAQSTAQWASDLTVTVPQVIAGGGYPALPAFMDDIGARVVRLEALIPSTFAGVASTTAGTGMSIVLPDTAEVLNYRGATAVIDKGALDPTKLPAHAPYLLPAIHDASLDALPVPLPAASGNAGKVYTAGADTLIPGAGGIRSATVASGGLVGCDGRALYPVAAAPGTNSYHPTAFERELYDLPINDKMLPVGSTLLVEWGVLLQLVNANCKARWVLVVDLGTFVSDTSPSPVGLNLAQVQWSSTPIFTQPIDLSSEPMTHSFGIRIKRNADAIALDQARYGRYLGNNDAAPTTANFSLRARLANFDTENVANPRGWLFYAIVGSVTTGTDGKITTTPAKAIIS